MYIHIAFNRRCLVECFVRCLLMTVTATHCNTLQHTATQCITLQHTATCCNTMQYAATHCNTLQHIATRCNTLHYTPNMCHDSSICLTLLTMHSHTGHITYHNQVCGGGGYSDHKLGSAQNGFFAGRAKEKCANTIETCSAKIAEKSSSSSRREQGR